MRVYTINPSTGAATQIGTTPFSTSLPAGGTWSVDFNPTVDRVRVVHSGGLNLRVNQTDGTLAATDTAVSAGTVNALAYDRSVAGTTGTTLYVLDGTADRLASMGSINSAPQSPNSGVLNAIGGLGTDAQADIAFDIAPASSAFAGTAIATMQVGGTQGLYTVDLRTGAATLQGTVAAALIDLAVLAPTPLLALTGDGAGILRFDASSPSVVSDPIAISGLGAGEIIVGFDVRPATGQLIGIGLRGGEGRVLPHRSDDGCRDADRHDTVRHRTAGRRRVDDRLQPHGRSDPRGALERTQPSSQPEQWRTSRCSNQRHGDRRRDDHRRRCL